jgi:NADH-quinone oxidoreductase subunit H
MDALYAFFDAVNDLFNTIGNWFYGLLTTTLALDVSVADPIFRLVQAIIVCTFAAVTFLALTYTERKIIARVQDRIGPNRVGPFGLFQPLADAIKMFTKEQTMPKVADAITFQLAPTIAAVPVLMLFAVIPFNENVVASDMDVGLIYIIAFGSLAEIAILMGGWGSRNKYSLLGAMRAVAQMISYEIPLVLALMSIAMLSGSLNLNDIVRAQNLPFVLLMPVAFIIFVISAAAETGRSPFDIIEAESEIIAGYHTEYAGMQFGLFQMAEFLGFYAQSCIMATIFFGGWQGPPFIPGWLWFWLKSWIGVFIFQWAFRSTFPRLRIDQLQAFCWKFLVPASLLNVGITAIIGKLHLLGLPFIKPLVTGYMVNADTGLRQAMFGPQNTAEWAILLVTYLLANVLTVVILMVAYRGMVRRTDAQLDSKVPGGLTPAPVEREVAAV